jgi:aryl-alcohol dehydrogenase-like predicted oxidoreductase
MGAMEYRNLGRSGLKVSRLCLGAMMFGDRTDATEAARIVASAREAGVNFIDTADLYAKGESERITGKLVASERDWWVVATKTGQPRAGEPQRGIGRKWLMQSIDASLARLGTDWVDIYYLHRDHSDVPMEEPVTAMGDLIKAGKIRYWGVSNIRGWRIAEAASVADRLGVPRPVVCQPYYNAMNRQPENEILPACGHFGIGVVPYSPLARGVLTGKYAPGVEPPADSRVGRKDKRIMETEFREESLQIAQQLKAHAEAKGLTLAHFAQGWVLGNAIVDSVLAGPRTLEQWQSYVAGLETRLDAEDEALVDRLVHVGHPSTPGYNDPNYAITGRPVKY